jgi:hypothetical protein
MFKKKGDEAEKKHNSKEESKEKGGKGKFPFWLKFKKGKKKMGSKK